MALPFAAVAAKGVVFLVLRNRWKSMRVLKLRAVSEKTGLKSSAIYNRIAQGAFPRQVSLGRSRSAGSRAKWIRGSLP